jgi:hypothetical protein
VGGAPPAQIEKLPPDASTAELTQALDAVVPVDARSDSWKEIAAVAKRLLDWQEVLNATRAPAKQINFHRIVMGFPIDKPIEYNGDIIQKKYRDSLEALPAEMKAVVSSLTQPLPEKIQLSGEEFENAGSPIVRAYDLATRWEALSLYLNHYAERETLDIRGYYFLSQTPDLQGKLQHWNELPQEEAGLYSAWLVGLCRNNERPPGMCRKTLEEERMGGDLRAYYARYIEAAKALYEGLFKIRESRTDVSWRSKAPAGPDFPFVKPAKPGLADIFQNSVESAWKGNGWALRLNYLDTEDAEKPHIVFEPGVTPHVNRLGGSEIVMDENVPLEGSLNRSAFAHEFGHIIGFPDCYVEFYDQNRGVMVNYQADLANIMCSRLGKVLPLHFTELQRVYGAGRNPSAAKKKRKTR